MAQQVSQKRWGMLSRADAPNDNICSRRTYAGVQVMSFGIKCLCAAAIKRKNVSKSQQKSARASPIVSGFPSGYRLYGRGGCDACTGTLNVLLRFPLAEMRSKYACGGRSPGTITFT
jgi:hypothetical protein